ncbi:transposase, partial [Salmonella enterica subsp. enterica serovar Kentucky]|nr:transposase [Salmonella enterica subsp. enterica serovar Kentucky]
AWYESATPSSRGRPQRYSDLAITTVLVIKRVFRLTLRAAQGFNAEILHKSRTDFILETACQAAEKVILDRRVFNFNDEQYEEFIN